MQEEAAQIMSTVTKEGIAYHNHRGMSGVCWQQVWIQLLHSLGQPLHFCHCQQHGGMFCFHCQHLALGIQRSNLLLVSFDLLSQLLRKHFFPPSADAAGKGHRTGSISASAAEWSCLLPAQPIPWQRCRSADEQDVASRGTRPRSSGRAATPPSGAAAARGSVRTAPQSAGTDGPTDGRLTFASCLNLSPPLWAARCSKGERLSLFLPYFPPPPIYFHLSEEDEAPPLSACQGNEVM